MDYNAAARRPLSRRSRPLRERIGDTPAPLNLAGRSSSSTDVAQVTRSESANWTPEWGVWQSSTVTHSRDGRLQQEYAIETLGVGTVNRQALMESNQRFLENPAHPFQAAANNRDAHYLWVLILRRYLMSPQIQVL